MSNVVTLSECCTFIKDGTHASPLRTRVGIPVLSAAHVRDGRLHFDTDRFTSEEELLIFQKRLKPVLGDVLLTIVGTIGRTAIVDRDRPFVFQRSVCVLRPKMNVVIPAYLKAVLESGAVKSQFHVEKHEVAQAGIYLEALNEIKIPLPPLGEQERVTTLLHKADRLRRTRRYALELTEAFLPAAFLELFGETGDSFPALTVDELAADKPHAIRTGPFGSQLLHSEFTNRGIAVLGIDNAVNNEFAWSQRRFITTEKYEQLKRYTVFPGDVIITIMGTCGRCAIVPNDIPTAINTKHLCCITLDQTRCLPIYLHGAFLFHPFVRRQQTVATKGSIMDGLNMEIIKSLRIPLPPLELQQEFAAVVKRVERLRAVQREALRQAEHLFQALLHRAFSGQSSKCMAQQAT